MGEIWIPEAERLGSGSIGGTMDTPNAPPRVVWHTTESGAGNTAFTNVGAYLTSAASEPHILYDPTTDRLGQYGPLNQSARALRNAGTVRTNRTGKVCIQIEVLAKAGTAFTGYWKPGKNFRALLRAIRSWGVPDDWPAGRLAQSYSDDSPRSLSIWQTRGGHYGHSNIPGNDHWDPGAIDRTALLAAGAAQPTTPPSQEDIVTPAEIQAVAEAVWNYQLPNLRNDGTPDGTKKSAYWWLIWQDVFQAQTLKAIADSKLKPADIAAALADGTLKLKLVVEPAATPKAV
jgi:hypothetical protein